MTHTLMDDLLTMQDTAKTQLSRSEAQRDKITEIFKSTDSIAKLIEREKENKVALSKRVRDVKTLMDKLGLSIELIGAQTSKEKKTISLLQQKLKSAIESLKKYEESNFFVKLFSDSKELETAKVDAEVTLKHTSNAIQDKVASRMRDPKIEDALKNTMKQIDKIIETVSQEHEIMISGISRLETKLEDEWKVEHGLVEQMNQNDTLLNDLESKSFMLKEKGKLEQDEEAKTLIAQELARITESLKVARNEQASNATLLEKSRSGQAQFRIALEAANETKQFQDTMIKSLTMQKKQNEELYKQRVDIMRSAAQLEVAVGLDDHLTDTAIDNANQIAATASVMSSERLSTLNKSAEARQIIADTYRSTKRHVDGVNAKTAKQSENTRKSYGLDFD